MKRIYIIIITQIAVIILGLGILYLFYTIALTNHYVGDFITYISKDLNLFDVVITLMFSALMFRPIFRFLNKYFNK